MERNPGKERAIEELLDEKLHKAFQQSGSQLSFLDDFGPDPGTPVPDPAFVAAKADRKKKTRFMKVASVFVIAGICGTMVFQGVNTENPPVAGHENIMDQMEDKGNGIFMAGDALDAEEIVIERTITDESLLVNAGEVMEGLLIPFGLPKEYEFESLQIRTHESGYAKAQYCYKKNGEEELFIVQEQYADITASAFQWETTDHFVFSERDAYWAKDALTGTQILRILMSEQEEFYVGGHADEEILLQIAEGLLPD